MENPVTNGNYTKEDVRDYAYYRKGCELYNIEGLLKDKKVQEGELSPDEHEDYRDALAISKETVVKIELSWGGDADGFKLTFDQNNQLISGVYYWADWGVYEEVELTENELEAVNRLYYVTDWLLGV